jgi:hypothetical protein
MSLFAGGLPEPLGRIAMTAALKTSNPVKELEAELVRMANAQFQSPEFKRLLGLRFNKKRAQMYVIQRTIWQTNRRDCWAAVQSLAPYAVKQVIWDHEREELEGNKALGKADHLAMSVAEGIACGATKEDFERIGATDGCITCCLAWLQVARGSHWLSAIAASAALELSNSDELVEGGSMSRRMAVKFRDEAGIPFKKQTANVEHMAADVEHAHLLFEVAREYVKNDYDIELMLEGARKSWSVDRVWKGHLADLLAQIPE